MIHVAVTFNGSDASIFVSGELIAQSDMCGAQVRA